MTVITCIAPVNIAVIKYWGKRDQELILPINDSISATLNTEQMCTKTTVMACADFKEDRIWLNGKEETMNNVRLQNCLKELKSRAQVSDEIKNWKIHICSENNFPTAAGLASSAAGYACLVSALSKLYKVEGDLSVVARIGSGSACRSIHGGFVRWFMGKDDKGVDSVAKQIVPASHWPDMRILILVVNDRKKKVPSSVGMQRSVATSDLLNFRAKHIVPKRTEEMQEAIVNKDFPKFAELTIKDSNQLHAICLDTYPPCLYMNDVSRLIMDFVHAYNELVKKLSVAYTFDAGPNATLFLLENEVPKFMELLNYYFPPNDNSGVEYKKGIPINFEVLSQEIVNSLNFEKQKAGLLKYIIHTKVGSEPQYLEEPSQHLLNNSGYPVTK